MHLQSNAFNRFQILISDAVAKSENFDALTASRFPMLRKYRETKSILR